MTRPSFGVLVRRHVKRLSRHPIANHIAAAMVKGALRLFSALGPDRAGAITGFLTKTIGQVMPEHRVALRNLALAFPEKSPRERRRILAAAWENLGRVGAEYPHLRAIVDSYDRPAEACRLEIVGLDRFLALRDSPKPAIIFSAHLANWEIPAVAAVKYGLRLVSLFRPPSNSVIGEDLLALRTELIGELVPTTGNAAMEMAAAIEKGLSIGLIVDQRVAGRLEVPFFGRNVQVSPLLARLAREYECPVYGVRCIRLGGARFKVEMTPPLELPRDASGKIDVQGTMAKVNQVLENWIRENPGQWLWMHNRWRPRPTQS